MDTVRRSRLTTALDAISLLSWLTANRGGCWTRHEKKARSVGKGARRKPNIPVQRQVQDAEPMIPQLPNERNGSDRSRKATQAARNRLQVSPYRAIRGLSCDCRGGMLFLRGHLPTFCQKQLAQEAVAKLEGVWRVFNETVVDAARG